MSPNEIFRLLLDEAHFTSQVLGAGVTQLRRASYASKGAYFQSFASLSTGLERIGKLCIILDAFVEKQLFLDQGNLKKFSHNLAGIYKKSEDIVAKRKIRFEHLTHLDDPIHCSIINVLGEFANNGRYSNLDILSGQMNSADPIKLWYEKVDQIIFTNSINPKVKVRIERNSKMLAESMKSTSVVRHISESGEPITTVADASRRGCIREAVAPYRQLYVLQIIRYWVEILCALQHKAQSESNCIPHFDEVFARFTNDDVIFRGRKTWNTT